MKLLTKSIETKLQKQYSMGSSFDQKGRIEDFCDKSRNLVSDESRSQ